MFTSDTKNQIRSGQPIKGNWQVSNRAGAAQQHTTAEGVAAQAAIVGRGRNLRVPVGDAGWQTPNKELDPTVAVAKGVYVYITAGNPLVTAGLSDLVSGLNTNSSPGIWQAAQNVPAQTTMPPTGMPAGTYYNVPQLPYPGATGAVSGSPLAGDLDGAQVFWIKRGDAPICF